MNDDKNFELQEGNGVLPCVIPRFCWVCGHRLSEVGLGFYKCSNEKCNAQYLPSRKDETNVQSLDLLP